MCTHNMTYCLTVYICRRLSENEEKLSPHVANKTPHSPTARHSPGPQVMVDEPNIKTVIIMCVCVCVCVCACRNVQWVVMYWLRLKREQN